ncbi:hypothetical protein [Victivallis vadensis]|uniref:hypothetical protein n=1 Tax=Victivallis vadensis TaxID=172901 RepID=UPI003AF7B70A
MKKLLGPACFAALLALFAAGCATTEVEEPIPVDITLEELQSKMTRAMDPTGRYAKAKTYTMQQTTSTERFLDDPEVQRVEVKFARPDSFSLTTYEDNEPLSGMIDNGKNGWVADYRRRKVVQLDGKQLEQLKMLSSIASPDSTYRKIFASAELSGCRIDGKDYYKITCLHREPDQGPTEIYVDREEFLPRRWKTSFKAGNNRVDYDSRIDKYSLRDGVMIPDETTTVQNGHKQTTTVTYYRLNTAISPRTFRPPLF